MIGPNKARGAEFVALKKAWILPNKWSMFAGLKIWGKARFSPNLVLIFSITQIRRYPGFGDRRSRVKPRRLQEDSSREISSPFL